MNYLAHIHIAHQCHSCLLGNLLGDFVKGNPDGIFPVETAGGIRLHRCVDAYTDAHPLISDIKRYFPSKQRRFAPIALDIFWDHCLSRQWQRFELMPLAEFSDYAQRVIIRKETDMAAVLPARYIDISTKMWQKHWLSSYGEWDNVCFAIERVSQRRPVFYPLRQCIQTLTMEYDVLFDAFECLYTDVLRYASSLSPGRRAPVRDAC